MTQEITNPQVCVLVRGGLELWIDAEKMDGLKQTLNDASKKFININGQLVNPFEILGVFTPDAMEDRQRRKNGQWKCLKGNWHDKGNVCACREYTETVVRWVNGEEIRYKK